MKWPKTLFPSSRRNSYREPTHHGRLPLYILQAFQLFASVVVLGIMLYFVNQLRGSRMTIPWSFIIHLVVSAMSTSTIILLLAVYTGAARPPARTLILNGVLLGLWALSLGLLVHVAKATITSQCSAATWNNSTGVMVCRLYQTLFAFIIIALASTALALTYLAHARHSNPQSYTKTPNPALFPHTYSPPEDDASEFANFAPSSAPLSAPSYVSSFRSPLPDDRSLGFPTSPSQRGGDTGSKMGEGRRGVFQPPLASPGLLTPEMGGMKGGVDKGREEDAAEVTEFSFLSPGGRYDRNERDLSA